MVKKRDIRINKDPSTQIVRLNSIFGASLLLQVLDMFLEYPDDLMNLREAARRVGKKPGSLSPVLPKLLERELITGKKIGKKIVAYRLNKESPVVKKWVDFYAYENNEYKFKLEMIHVHSVLIEKAESVESILETTESVLTSILGYDLVDLIKIENNYLVDVNHEESFQIPLNERSITSRAARLGISQLVNDTRLDPDYVKRNHDKTMLSELVVPVKVEGSVDYLINIENEFPGAFNTYDVKLVETLAQHVTSAMHRFKQSTQIKTSNERFNGLFSNMVEGVAVYRAVDDGNDFVFSDFNQASEMLEQKLRDDVIDRRITEVFPGVKELGFLEVLQRVYLTGAPERRPIIQYNGEQIKSWRENYVFRLSSGEVVAVYHDLTDKKRSDEMLRKSEELFRGFIQSASDRYSLMDKEMHIIEINESSLQYLGLGREDVIGKHVLELWPGLKETGRYDEYLRVLETGEPLEYHAVESLIDQGNIVDISAFKMGEVLGVATRDISEQIWHQRRIEALHIHAVELASLDSKEDIARRTMEIIRDLLEYRIGSFGFVEEGKIVFKEGRELSSIHELDLDGEGITVRAVNTGKTQLVIDTRTDPDYVSGRSDEDVETLSELDIPILVRGNVVAVINLEGDGVGSFQTEDQVILEILALHVGSALTRFNFIEQLKTYVEVLEASKERWEELISSIPDPVLINDSTHYLYANQQAAEMWGVESPTDIIGHEFSDFFPDDIAPELVKRAKDRLEGKPVLSRYETSIKRPDGKIVPSRVSLRVITYENKPAILSIHRDISERKRSEERLASVHSFSLELGFTESLEEVIETSFGIMREVLGYKSSSFQILEEEGLVTVSTDGYPLLGLVLPLTGKGITSRAAREARSILVGDVRLDPDYIQVTSDSLSELAVPIMIEDRVLGVINVESLELNAFDDNDIRLMEVLASNIGSALHRLRTATEKASLEGELLGEQLRSEHERGLRQMKTRFMSTVAHELRTPLASIQGYSELIQMNEENLSDAQRQYFEVIQRNVKRLSVLTDDLFDLQRLEEGRMTVNLELVNIRDLLGDIMNEFAPILAEKKQRLDVNCVDVVVSIDRMRVMQVVVNLLSNASKFSPDGSEIAVEVVDTGSGIQVSVSDEGIGISEEDMAKLFTPFPGIRVKSNVHGAGLGLSICKGIVEMHGGKIWVESPGAGKGSRFSLTLPNNK